MLDVSILDGEAIAIRNLLEHCRVLSKALEKYGPCHNCIIVREPGMKAEDYCHKDNNEPCPAEIAKMYEVKDV